MRIELLHPGSSPEGRLSLPQVTLCAVSSVNVDVTLRAVEACLEQIDFADCLLFTHATVQPVAPDIRVVPIERLHSAHDYSQFILSRLVDYIHTSHCLVVQWDGYILDARRWRPQFLDYDYIGARWPQFDDGYDVGNGGFSLRSRRLMDACRDAGFTAFPVEDLAIGRVNRFWLEQRGMTFAPAALADCFSAERAGHIDKAFGFHGVFNMPQAVGMEAFWNVYRDLDDRGTLKHDFVNLIKSVFRERYGLRRAFRMVVDRLK